jgi:hypothetical protein
MEELLIEEKKYVSSKRAAKMTGYAKDYIGQLCREGRVPARLVGRSWYVLESAIQDHRFGNQETESPATVMMAQSTGFSLPQTWKFPRYEAAQTETLPSLNRLDDIGEAREGALEAPQDLQESWKEWFDHVADSSPAVEEPSFVDEGLAPTAHEEEDQEIVVEEPANVPLRVIHHQLPDPEMLQERVTKREMAYEHPESRTLVGNRIMFTVRVAGALFSVAAVSLAIVGSGYFDAYLTSGSPASVISGLSVYAK